MIHSWPAGQDKLSQFRANGGTHVAPPKVGISSGNSTQTSLGPQVTLLQVDGTGGEVGGDDVLVEGEMVETPGVKGVSVVVMEDVGGAVDNRSRIKLKYRIVRLNADLKQAPEVTMLGCMVTTQPESSSPQLEALQTAEVFRKDRVLDRTQLAIVISAAI